MLGELIPIYHAAGKMHVPPPVVDTMEIWQVAAMFGVDLDGDEDGHLPSGVGDMRRGWIDPNVLQRARRHMGQVAPDIPIRGFHPERGSTV